MNQNLQNIENLISRTFGVSIVKAEHSAKVHMIFRAIVMDMCLR